MWTKEVSFSRAPTVAEAPAPEPEVAAVPAPAPAAGVHAPVTADELPPLPEEDAKKVPFWKKDISLGGGKKKEKQPKAERAPKQQKEKKQKAPKAPFALFLLLRSALVRLLLLLLAAARARISFFQNGTFFSSSSGSSSGGGFVGCHRRVRRGCGLGGSLGLRRRSAAARAHGLRQALLSGLNDTGADRDRLLRPPPDSAGAGS